MTPLTHNQFLKLFSDLAIAHKDINSFGAGDLWEYMANENSINPVTMWVVTDQNGLIGKTDKPKYSFVIMDAVDKGENCENEVVSDTLRIAKDIVALLRQPYYESFFTFEQNITFDNFTERFDSEMTGWQFDITFNQPFLYDACVVNIDGLPVINSGPIYINTNLTVWGQITGTLSNQTDLQTALNAKQATLISGTNIKTINGTSILGSGDLVISAGVTSVFGRTGAVVAVAGDYTTSLVTEGTNLYFTEPRVRATVLTGLSIAGGSISATDSILTALGKVQNQINGVLGGAIYQSVWNATTNSPALASGVGTKGYYYVVNVAGSTNLDGVTDWKVGDWAIFNGTTWDKVDNTDAVSSVNGTIGAVVITTTGTTNRISVSGGGGLTPTIDIDAGYVGQTSLTTLGTIGTGVWQGTSIGTTYTDAKIKGSIASTQIAVGSAADTISGSGALTYTGNLFENFVSTNGAVTVQSRNTNASGSAYAILKASNGTSSLDVWMTGTGYTTSGNFRANTGVISSSGGGGLILYCASNGANEHLRFYTNAAERGKILSTGELNFGNAVTTNQRIVRIGQGTAFLDIGERVTTGGSIALYANQASPSSSNWFIRSDGADTLFNATAGALTFQTTNTNRYVIANTTGAHTWTTGNATSSATTYFNWTAGNSTSQTASIAIPKARMTLGTCQWVSGAGPAHQAYVHYTQPTGSVSGSSTFPMNTTFCIDGAPIAGTNMTQTETVALFIDNVASVSSAGTSHGIYAKAQTGGTVNWAITSYGDMQVTNGGIFQLGNAAVTGLTPGVLAATTNATIVMYDSTGQAYRIPCII